MDHYRGLQKPVVNLYGWDPHWVSRVSPQVDLLGIRARLHWKVNLTFQGGLLENWIPTLNDAGHVLKKYHNYENMSKKYGSFKYCKQIKRYRRLLSLFKKLLPK